MKIAFVIGSLSGGGAERVVALLANEFAEQGNSTYVISIASKNRSYEISPKVKLLYCTRERGIPGVSFFNRVGDLRNTLNEIKPDVCFSFTVAVNIYSILASVGQKWRLIVCERNDPNFDPKSKFLRMLRSITYYWADGYVFQTTGERDFFPQKIRDKSWVIPNPINPLFTDVYHGERQKRFVTAVRLEPQKNLKLAINAFEKFNQSHPDYSFEIYGEGNQYEELNNYIISKKMENKVFLKGRSNTLHKDISSAYAFILSSDYEGMSNSMIEAMALGLPVISTDYPSGGARMVINDHINGLLIPVGGLNELVKAMNEVVENPQLAEQLSYNAKQIRNELSTSRVIRMWSSCLNNKAGSEL